MEIVTSSTKKFIKNNIRNIPDFPKPGIQYKDITPLLQDADGLKLTSYLLARPFYNHTVDYVIGLESRGFLFGTNLAQDLHAGFIPVRKPGKLPDETISAVYALEYGEDKLEIHANALPKGASVIIHDDLIATGGSAKAATELVEKLGGVVVGYSFIVELKALKGRKNLPDGIPVEVLVDL